MMMTELPLGLSMTLGGKAVPLAHLVKRLDERPISMMMAEFPLGLSMIMGNGVGARPTSMMMTELHLELSMMMGRKKAALHSTPFETACQLPQN